jgi:hypothetical protein
LNSLALGVKSLDERSSILGENGSNPIGFMSALQGFLQYMEELLMVCEGDGRVKYHSFTSRTRSDGYACVESTICIVWCGG